MIPFTPCALCPRWTFASYGAAPLSLNCATAPTTPARVAYRQALSRVWALAAEEERADPGACAAALNCPTCGEPGPLHGDE